MAQILNQMQYTPGVLDCPKLPRDPRYKVTLTARPLLTLVTVRVHTLCIYEQEVCSLTVR
jgi:hypothetical protein